MERSDRWHRLIPYCFVVIASFMLGNIPCHASEVAQSDGYMFNGEDCSPYLGRELSILEDKEGGMNISEVLHSRMFRSQSDIPDLGLGRSAYWVRLSLYNLSSSNRIFLHIAHSEIDELDIYELTDNEGVKRIAHAGLSREVNKTSQPTSEFAFPVEIPQFTKGTFLIRLRSTKQLRLPITVESYLGFYSRQLNRNLFLGGYLGIMLVMALYNLFIFISTREKAYAFYVGYIILVSLTQMAFIGMLAFTAFSGLPWLSAHSALYLTAFTAIAAGEFMVRFIQMRDLYPRRMMVMRLFYIVLVLGLVMDMSGRSSMAYRMIQVGAGSFALFQLVVLIQVAAKGSRPARYFLLAWISFLLGIISFILKDLGVLPFNDLTRFAMTIGSAVEVVLLSFGLADRINVLRQEKELSQAKAIAMAQENELFVVNQNVELERKVTERTHALQETNDHLKRTQTQLVSAEKMASLGQLTAGIAHEINNPLNFISSSIPPLKRDLLDLKEVLDAYRNVTKDGTGLEAVRALEERIGVDFTVNEVEEILKCMETGASRTSEIVRGLRTFSRLDEDDLKTADINEGLRSTVVVLGPQFRDVVKIEYDLGEIPQVECYPGKLNQVFMNLLNNAAHAVKQRHGNTGGSIKIATRLSGDSVTVTITDNGMGMEESVKSRLFEPFFTTKGVGEGTGLGLSIVQGIIEKHNGLIELDSAVGQGTRFTLTLPVLQTVKLAKSA